MTKDVYATAKESASVMKPDTRTNAEKILYELQKEQTNGFEQGHEIDNGKIALQLIEQNLELLGALKKAKEDINWMLNSRRFLNGFVFNYIDEAIAKSTGQSK